MFLFNHKTTQDAGLGLVTFFIQVLSAPYRTAQTRLERRGHHFEPQGGLEAGPYSKLAEERQLSTISSRSKLVSDVPIKKNRPNQPGQNGSQKFSIYTLSTLLG